MRTTVVRFFLLSSLPTNLEQLSSNKKKKKKEESLSSPHPKVAEISTERDFLCQLVTGFYNRELLQIQ